ncbi:hypothetical protein L2Q67_004700 [Salmonella enterica]|nr:hypothetical protein [Salmonella enterica]
MKTALQIVLLILLVVMVAIEYFILLLKEVNEWVSIGVRLSSAAVGLNINHNPNNSILNTMIELVRERRRTREAEGE